MGTPRVVERIKTKERKPLDSAVKLYEISKKADICEYKPLKVTNQDIRTANRIPVMS